MRHGGVGVRAQRIFVVFMDQSTKMWAYVAVALVVGLGGGYYYGKSVGVKQEQAVEAARKAEADKAAAQAINPFQKTTANPFEKAPANPFDNVKVNPFK